MTLFFFGSLNIEKEALLCIRDSKKIDKNTLRLVDEYIRELNFIK